MSTGTSVPPTDTTDEDLYFCYLRREKDICRALQELCHPGEGEEALILERQSNPMSREQFERKLAKMGPAEREEHAAELRIPWEQYFQESSRRVGEALLEIETDPEARARVAKELGLI